MQSITITDVQSFDVQAHPIDGAGAPGVLAAGAVGSYSTNNPAVAIVTTRTDVDPSGLTGSVKAIGPGVATITCTDDNPTGSFSQGFTVIVTGGNAVGFNFNFGPAS